WMATTLAPVDSREVVKCDYCRLVQFRTASNNCRKCHKCLDRPEPEPAPVEPVPAHAQGTGNGNGNGHTHLQLAMSIRLIRQRNGLSQRQLALRMQVPRTYVSKIENEKATPTLSSIARLARALEVTVPDLLNGSDGREAEIRDLMNDAFIAELVPYLSKLDGMQWSSVLTQVRDLSLRPRRHS
ncbi:MAG: helix-turn-helix domain-containing protein, partial [Terriglobales bacterium]